MLKKLRTKFVCITMLIFTLMLCVIFGLIINSTSHRLEMQSIQLMQTLTGGPFRGNRPNDLPESARIPYFILELEHDGTIRNTYSNYYDLSDESFLQEIIGQVSQTTEEPTGRLDAYSLRFHVNKTPRGEMIVFMDTSNERMMLDSLLKNCLLIGAAALLVFFGISLLLARWAIRPVEQAWEQQKQFVADASHELKTPLTVILTNAELLQDPTQDQKARGQFAQNILAMAHQMRGLTENLLDLARVDNGRIQTMLNKCDLSRLITDALLPFEPLCYEKGLTLSGDLAEHLTVNGSESHLRQVVDILLDNATKYSPAPAEIRYSLEKQGNHALFSVSNPGESLTKEELVNIFKRFYRLDKARTMNHSYGLGLSIADAIIREHHGRIWAECKDGRISFRVELPLC